VMVGTVRVSKGCVCVELVSRNQPIPTKTLIDGVGRPVSTLAFREVFFLSRAVKISCGRPLRLRNAHPSAVKSFYRPCLRERRYSSMRRCSAVHVHNLGRSSADGNLIVLFAVQLHIWTVPPKNDELDAGSAPSFVRHHNVRP
jgi:hypothetical protein